jgi:Tfp pilus assembly major pilin PilA
MPQREIDSPSSGGAQLVASLLARIDGLMVQIAARDNRIDELLAQVKALNARIAEFEAKRGEDAGQFLAAAFARSEGERRAAGGQAAAQGPARRRAKAGGESRRDATLLR